MKPTKLLLAIILVFFSDTYGQEPEKVHEFGRPTNDELMTRVNFFADDLAKTGSTGFIKLNGPKWLQYRYLRKIEGCNWWWKRPVDLFKFMLGVEQNDLRIEFWRVPEPNRSNYFIPTVLDYRLPRLSESVEATVSGGTDEYCPTHFDVEWFSKFMVANPTFKGKAVFDTSKRDFLTRVLKYKKQLKVLGVNTSRVRFLRSHFYHERDEKWWLVPPKNK